jgi:hypothetical protein
MAPRAAPRALSESNVTTMARTLVLLTNNSSTQLFFRVLFRMSNGMCMTDVYVVSDLLSVNVGVAPGAYAEHAQAYV